MADSFLSNDKVEDAISKELYLPEFGVKRRKIIFNKKVDTSEGSKCSIDVNICTLRLRTEYQSCAKTSISRFTND